MGNPLITANPRIRILLGVLLLGSIYVAASAFFSPAKKFLTSYNIRYYHYNPSAPIMSLVDTSGMPPATAVPVLMYHGITEKMDDSNTTLDNFIKQMEMLKRDGYQTISVHEFDLFRQGKFVLPPKPIIITFDDGRKDSYYPTDDVLNKLGFKATIFVASGPAYTGNSFFLDWSELQTMAQSGRWEIEAHGRHSHERIPITAHDAIPGGDGRYLTSLMYLTSTNKLETPDEFRKRVENDYIGNIQDLENRVGVEPRYFAIPLNDYGQQSPSNYAEATPFNQNLIRKYFRIAFIQANNSDDVHTIRLPVYNLKTDDPYFTKRIEVKNMTTDFLKSVLDDDRPTLPKLSLSASGFKPTAYNDQFTQGTTTFGIFGVHLLAPEPGSSGQILFGQSYWRDYKAQAVMGLETGRSIVLLFNYKDNSNYLSFGRTDNGYFIRSTVNGTTTDLADPVGASVKEPASGPLSFSIAEKDGIVTCSVNGKAVFKSINVPEMNGGVGFRVWSDTDTAQGSLKSLDVEPM